MNRDFIESSQPFVDIDGNSYPYLSLNLSISGIPNTDNTNIGAAIATRLTPFRVHEDGLITFAPDGEQSFVYGDAYQSAQTDPALAACVLAIKDAIQAFVTAKGA